MIDRPNFQPGKKYALDGATLNALYEAVAECRILPSDEYEIQRDPGKGTRLKDIKSTPYRPRWDLVSAAEGQHQIYAPRVIAAYGSAEVIEIENVPLTLASNSWVVAKIDDLEADPWTLVTELVDAEEDGSLQVYRFNETGVLDRVRFPLWQILDAAEPGAKQIGALWAVKHVGDGVQTLGSMHVTVPDRPISRSVPRLISL